MSKVLCYKFGDSSSTLGFVAGPPIVLICVRKCPQLYGFVHCFLAFIVLLSSDLNDRIGGIFCLCRKQQEICFHCFCVDSSTVAYKAWPYGFHQFTFRFILA